MGIFTIIFKTIVELLAEPLKKRLGQRKDVWLPSLLQLFHHLKRLGLAIESLEVALDVAIADLVKCKSALLSAGQRDKTELPPELSELRDRRIDYGTMNGLLREIGETVQLLRHDLATVTPGLEIYAEQIAKAIDNLVTIEDFYVNKALPEDIINWAAPMVTPNENTIDWPSELKKVRDDAEQSRKAIAGFIRENYDLKSFIERTT
jgi:hypothetical protein